MIDWMVRSFILREVKVDLKEYIYKKNLMTSFRILYSGLVSCLNMEIRA